MRERPWGDRDLELMAFEASKSAYDLALDIIDDPNGECLLMLVVRKDLYTIADAELPTKSYEILVKAFADAS